jgi:hypothetical protein
MAVFSWTHVLLVRLTDGRLACGLFVRELSSLSRATGVSGTVIHHHLVTRQHNQVAAPMSYGGHVPSGSGSARSSRCSLLHAQLAAPDLAYQRRSPRCIEVVQ